MITLAAHLLQHWKIGLFALVIVFAAVQSTRLTMTKKDLALLQTQTEQARIVAAAYTAESEKNLDTLRTAIPRMVASAQANALSNYKARYGAGNVACGLRPAGLLPADSQARADPAAGAKSADETERERLAFIESCARDAGRLDLWIAFATLNKLPIKD